MESHSAQIIPFPGRHLRCDAVSTLARVDAALHGCRAPDDTSDPKPVSMEMAWLRARLVCLLLRVEEAIIQGQSHLYLSAQEEAHLLFFSQ